MCFQHLKLAKQSYIQHFYDSFTYGCMAVKASFYFFVHSLYPDIYEWNGSSQIQFMNTLLQNKKRQVENVN
jgi:hypothetical protein